MATRDQMVKAEAIFRGRGDTESADKLKIAIQALDQQGAKDSKQLSPAKTPKTTKPESTKGTFLDPIAKGVLLGWPDELLAAGMAIPASAQTGRTIPEAYRGLRDKLRERSAGFEKRNPFAAPALEIAGAIPTGILGGARMLGASPSFKRMAGVGALEGGIAGVGAGKGNELTSGATGALIGAVLGPVGGLLPRFIPTTGRAAPQKELAKAVEADVLTPTLMRAQARQMGPDVTAADLGEGGGMMALSRAIASTSPKTRAYARQGLSNRLRKQTDKTLDVLEESTGVRPDYGLVYGQIDEVAQRRSAQARPLWDAARAHEVEMTPLLERALKLKSVKSAFKKAQEQAEFEGRELPKIFEEIDGELVSTGIKPDMDAWFMIKTHLKDVFKGKGYVDEITGRRTKLGNSAQDFLDDLVGELDKITGGDYAAARSAWAGKTAIIDALNDGRKMLNKPVSDVLRDVRGMGQSEKEAYLTGIMEAVRERMSLRQAGSASETKFLETDNFKQKLKSLLPPGREGQRALQKVIRELKTQRKFRETSGFVTAGSQTEPTRQVTKALEESPQGFGDILAGDPTSRIVSAAANWIGQRVKAVPREMREELAEIMFKPNGIEGAIEYLKQGGMSQQRVRDIAQKLRALPAAVGAGGVVAAQ